ncbi:MAG: 50S ribosomal protein L13 [bacterium]
MNTVNTISTIPRPADTARERQWHLVNADGEVLGRLASRIARLLIGKDKACYTPSVDCGDFVVVVNAKNVVLTGKKLQQKLFYRHSGYLGGLKQEPYSSLIARRPELAVRKAVWGMLPKTRLGRRMIVRLKVYPGANHRHGAQFPTNEDKKGQVK